MFLLSPKTKGNEAVLHSFSTVTHTKYMADRLA